MAVRRISELDAVDLSKFTDNNNNPTLSFKQSLLEISEWQQEQTFVSKSINLYDFSKIVSLFLSDPDTPGIIVHPVFGTPDTKRVCGTNMDAHTTYTCEKDVLSCMIPAQFTNKTIFYNNTYFHSNIDASGQTIVCNILNGTATRARWADLAEKYAADADYDPGTLVKFGGDEEITVADNKVNAVVTSNPGILLNADKIEKNFVGIALAGRVPVKIKGAVKKFDKIVLSSEKGIGCVCNNAPDNKIIGVALENSEIEDIKLVECSTRFLLE